MKTMEEILARARIVGEKAHVDAVPDPTEEGYRMWKEDLLTYFGCAADNFLSENPAEEIHDKILMAMQEGFSKLVLSQPFVDVPLNPMGTPPRIREIQIIGEVFSELKTIPHHCTH
ncbi:MAG: hypothetical protein VST70_00465 [Nitrospirota bacterium]|nr:hypothetical protein [Nitrospirota bacterium]